MSEGCLWVVGVRVGVVAVDRVSVPQPARWRQAW